MEHIKIKIKLLKEKFFLFSKNIITNRNKNRSPMFYCLFFLFLFLVISPVLIYFCSNSNIINKVSEEFKKDEKSKISEKQIKKSITKINLYNSKKNKTQELNLDQYVSCVLASEMPAAFELEALKAQAVAARTFAVSKSISKCPNAKGADICDTVHCQVYLDKEERLKSWGNGAVQNWNKIVQAVNETSGKVLMYEDELVMNPQFFAVSSGHTEDNVEVFKSNIPYLKSVDSKGEEEAPKFLTKVSLSNDKFVRNVNSSFKNANLKLKDLKNQIKVIDKTNSGMIKSIKVGGINVSGIEFRKALGLNSANFNIEFKNSSINITCKGYGHGVGMSQWGANHMAKEGAKFEEILKHYYTGVKIVDVND